MKNRLIALIAVSISMACAGAMAQSPAASPAGSLAMALSADAAAQVAVRGAVVVDVRARADYLAGHLPGAISVPFLAQGDLAALQEQVSRHGIDLSREVVVVGHAGDAAAQSAQARLAEYSTGRIFWLVGGVPEWALSGRPLATQAVSLPPVPQYLVRLQPQAGSLRMAAAAQRDVAVEFPLAAQSQIQARATPSL